MFPETAAESVRESFVPCVFHELLGGFMNDLVNSFLRALMDEPSAQRRLGLMILEVFSSLGLVVPFRP